MPGTYVLRPVEANLTHNTQFPGKMNPYCTFLLGDNAIKGQVCLGGGKHPFWYDTITIPTTNEESALKIEVKDKDKFIYDDTVGGSVIDLKEVQSKGQVSKWYPLIYRNKPAGEILIKAVFQPDRSAALSKSITFQKEEGARLSYSDRGSTTYSSQISMEREKEMMRKGPMRKSYSFIEQSQEIKPHSFQKQIDVVEIRPVQKEVEVWEPRKFIKEVQYTQAVPVKRKIELVQPQVVMKEIEVLEPTVVTKEIQVIEHVPVKKLVEVIELKTVLKEVQNFIPQTFTKQVEVTEQVPVKKQVTVTHPVTVLKPVEYVEPIITTRTITKEILQPMVVDEKVTVSVGPATLIGVESEVRGREFMERYEEVKVSEKERSLRQEEAVEKKRLDQWFNEGGKGNIQSQDIRKEPWATKVIGTEDTRG